MASLSFLVLVGGGGRDTAIECGWWQVSLLLSFNASPEHQLLIPKQSSWLPLIIFAKVAFHW